MVFSKVKRATRRVGSDELALVQMRFEALQAITNECAEFGNNFAKRMQAVNTADDAAVDDAIAKGREVQAGLAKALEQCSDEIEDAFFLFLGERRRDGEDVFRYVARVSAILGGPVDELVSVQRKNGIQLVS